MKSSSSSLKKSASTHCTEVSFPTHLHTHSGLFRTHLGPYIHFPSQREMPFSTLPVPHPIITWLAMLLANLKQHLFFYYSTRYLRTLQYIWQPWTIMKMTLCYYKYLDWTHFPGIWLVHEFFQHPLTKNIAINNSFQFVGLFSSSNKSFLSRCIFSVLRTDSSGRFNSASKHDEQSKSQDLISVWNI